MATVQQPVIKQEVETESMSEISQESSAAEIFTEFAPDTQSTLVTRQPSNESIASTAEVDETVSIVSSIVFLT